MINNRRWLCLLLFSRYNQVCLVWLLFRNVFFTLCVVFSYSLHQQTHVASGLGASSSTDHVGLDGATPPAGAGAGLVVNNGKVGLPHSGGHTSTSWRERQTCTVILRWLHTYSQNYDFEELHLTHWRCAHIQWCSRGGCGAGSRQ